MRLSRAAFPAASGLPRSVTAQVQQLLCTQSCHIYLLTILTENVTRLFWVFFNDARLRPNHTACNAFCISTVFVIWLTHLEGSQGFYLPPLLTCDMHIYENLTSFSVKETGNKQSSSLSHPRRDALSEDLGKRGQWVLSAGAGEKVGVGSQRSASGAASNLCLRTRDPWKL